MQDFHKLLVWQKGHALTLSIYAATGRFPIEERFALSIQMRRSCSSVPTNLAEASGRRGTRDRRRFFQISISSACELEYQLILARDLRYLDQPLYADLQTKLIEIKRMLAGLLGKLDSDG